MSKMGKHYQDVQQSEQYREGWIAAVRGEPMPNGEAQRVGFNDAQRDARDGGDPSDAINGDV